MRHSTDGTSGALLITCQSIITIIIIIIIIIIIAITTTTAAAAFARLGSKQTISEWLMWPCVQCFPLSSINNSFAMAVFFSYLLHLLLFF